MDEWSALDDQSGRQSHKAYLLSFLTGNAHYAPYQK
jgi:hypothetical protein